MTNHIKRHGQTDNKHKSFPNIIGACAHYEDDNKQSNRPDDECGGILVVPTWDIFENFYN